MENENNEIIITQHAYDRAKQRFSWKPDVLDKMAKKAFIEGIQHKELKSKLHKYITKIWFKHRACNNVRIYGENIFFFSNNILITTYLLPNDLRKYIKLSNKN